MKVTLKYLTGVILLMLIVFSGSILAQDTTSQKASQPQHGQHFVDENGDGYNDNAPDHDGDGIPNGLDPDWKKMQKRKRALQFVDLDGDGINDNLNAGTNPMNKHDKMQSRDKGSSVETNQQRQQKQRGKQKNRQ